MKPVGKWFSVLLALAVVGGSCASPPPAPEPESGLRGGESPHTDAVASPPDERFAPGTAPLGESGRLPQRPPAEGPRLRSVALLDAGLSASLTPGSEVESRSGGTPPDSVVVGSRQVHFAPEQSLETGGGAAAGPEAPPPPVQLTPEELDAIRAVLAERPGPSGTVRHRGVSEPVELRVNAPYQPGHYLYAPSVGMYGPGCLWLSDVTHSGEARDEVRLRFATVVGQRYLLDVSLGSPSGEIYWNGVSYAVEADVFSSFKYTFKATSSVTVHKLKFPWANGGCFYGATLYVL